MSGLLDALAERVVVADGAMGTALQDHDLSPDDFAGLEGCNEILNVTRPDVVRSVHRGYLEAGADAVETNTFGANCVEIARDQTREGSRTSSAPTTTAARAASCRPRSRATCTTSARTWSTSSCPTTATRSSTSASSSR